jgi:hypothetical protein
MKICVVMFYDKNVTFGNFSFEINQRYCLKNNIDIIKSNTNSYNNRTSHWERLPLIIKHLPNYDYIIWIDADAIFYEDSPNIESIINQHLDKDFIFSMDRPPLTNINTGVFIVKNTEYSRIFLEKWGYDEDIYKTNPHPLWFDQGCFIHMWNNNLLDIKSHSHVCNFNVLQSFHFTETNPHPIVFHSAGGDYKSKHKSIQSYYEKMFGISSPTPTPPRQFRRPLLHFT